MMKIAKKTIKTAFSMTMWAGKAAAFGMGLAVVLALTAGLASTALAGTGVGARFDLGKTNTVNAISKLVGSVAGPSLQIDNNSADANATALDLQVEQGKAPMAVNSETKVANLNADKIDGKDSSQFQQAGAPAPQNLTLINGWAKDQHTDPNTPAYYKDAEGVVHLEGAVECSPGGCSNKLATLPAGFRPNHSVFMPVAVGGGSYASIMVIEPDGDLHMSNPDGQGLTSLEGITFRAVQ